MMLVIIAVVIIFFVMLFVYLRNSSTLKTHDLRNLELGVDYTVDFEESGTSATLTTAITVQPQEKIILFYQNQAVVYRVEDTQQYWNDDEIKTLLLKKVDVVSE